MELQMMIEMHSAYKDQSKPWGQRLGDEERLGVPVQGGESLCEVLAATHSSVLLYSES
eukprot:CAMPEP_0180553258 /NCGR_PEP_ID=MMETSP1036_2-20121128/74207_1 /TAXON_ID=632150 /ORGANISM="Azadinium spinosum, Strain 3D9" /LENGTH=57 /DNA_ID=CAMNT_0022568815 /DNA_START=29 /DNA_END=199 /DNA_ORIENTATION=+